MVDKQDKQDHIERAILIYLKTRNNLASATELLDGLGVRCAIAKNSPSCYVRYKLDRVDIKYALRQLAARYEVTFVGNRKWKLTKNGEKKANIFIELQAPIIARYPKLISRRLIKRGFKLVSLEDVNAIATVAPNNMGRYGLGVKVSKDNVTIINARLQMVELPKSFFGNDIDFSDAEIIDCGNTIRFGNYEAALDKILDPVML